MGLFSTPGARGVMRTVTSGLETCSDRVMQYCRDQDKAGMQRITSPQSTHRNSMTCGRVNFRRASVSRAFSILSSSS
eukprot:6198775-Pleurochrysis_carterae.AAC.3